MKFSINREDILKPLQTVSGVVERRQTLPILSNVLVGLTDGQLNLTATDLEVELSTRVNADASSTGQVTFSARKFMDICRALPEGATLDVSEANGRVAIRTGKSRFSLATLPVADFPKLQDIKGVAKFSISQKQLKSVLEGTYFAMAQQDVRYYLNGLLIEVSDNTLRAVATDGHRLALCECSEIDRVTRPSQVIVPRKAILELLRLIEESDEKVDAVVSDTHIRFTTSDVTLTSKLIDGKFPDYDRVIPKETTKKVVVDCELVRQALNRAAILSNEKYRGVRLSLDNNSLTAVANNPELEEAEEIVDVEYTGEALEIGFNVNYIIDALAATGDKKAEMLFTDANSSCLVTPASSKNRKYVIMPMRL